MIGVEALQEEGEKNGEMGKFKRRRSQETGVGDRKEMRKEGAGEYWNSWLEDWGAGEPVLKSEALVGGR